MKMKHLMITLLIAITALLAAGGTAFAQSYNFNGNCSFDGEDIVSDFTSDDWAAQQGDLEPGDSVDYVIKYKNDHNKATNWYMRNEVLETLEESSDVAENGGYTYVLKNIGPDGTETVLFDNSEVGGEAKVADLEGLKQATNATTKYFFIQELQPGETGKTVLEVAFEGETEVNDYMDSEGSLMVSYAVTDGGIANNVRTGDDTSLWPYLALMLLALILGTLTVVSYKKDRKGGEEA